MFTSTHDATDARVFHREATSLAEAGYDLTYYTAFGHAGEIEGIDVEPLLETGDDRPPLPGVKTRLRRAYQLFEKVRGTDFDVYHFHDSELLPVGAFLSLTSDGVVIYDVHENVADVIRHKDLFPAPLRPALSTAVETIESALSRLVDGVVTASDDIAETFSHPNLVIVPNYPARKWAEEAPLPSVDAADSAEPTRFVYCGLLSEDRGIFTIMDAIERVPEEYDVTLTLGGKYPSDAVQERIERAASTNDRVELVGWQSTLADVIALFYESDVGMLCFHPDPNKTNAAHRSNKLFQYMAAAVPIVVSDIGNWTETIADEDCGVPVDPEDPEDIAAAMTDLVEDTEKRVTLGRNGHDAALKRYNWDIQREKLLRFYEQLIARS